LKANQSNFTDFLKEFFLCMKKTEASSEDIVTFSSLGVCKELCESCEQLKWTKPTPIQREALPVALEGKKR
jgi:ATP-dependent RNA helicase DDX47/RRP3